MKPTHLTTDDEIVRNKQLSLLELLDRLLDKGVVIKGEILLSVADIDLVYLNLGLFLSSVKTVVKAIGDTIAQDDATHTLSMLWQPSLAEEALETLPLAEMESERGFVEEILRVPTLLVDENKTIHHEEILEISQPITCSNEVILIEEIAEISLSKSKDTAIVSAKEIFENPQMHAGPSEVVLIEEVSQMLQMTVGNSEVVLADEALETLQMPSGQNEVILVEEISQMLHLADDENKMDDILHQTFSKADNQPKTNIDPENVEKGLTKLVLTLVDLLRKLMEKQAIQRIEAGQVNSRGIERVAETFFLLDQKMNQLKEAFGLQNEELNLDLGPLGELI